MKFYLDERQDKSGAFLRTLAEHGYERVARWQDGARFMLRNMDTRWQDLWAARRAGVRVFLHPHAVRMCCFWDGLYPVWPHTRCNFATSIGQKMVMEAYRYPIPVEVVGWPYTEIRPFEKTSGDKVLFAPIHPNARGIGLTTEDKQTNLRAFEILKGMKVDLVVRYGRDLRRNGLKRDASVQYQEAKLMIEDSIQAIEQADVVIAHQTFAWLAVALGKPTIMMSENEAPHNVKRAVRSWPKYRKILQYPLDILNCKDPRALIEQACTSDEKIKVWRERFIGEPFDAQHFIARLEAYLHGK
jgi:hypothetical protein